MPRAAILIAIALTLSACASGPRESPSPFSGSSSRTNDAVSAERVNIWNNAFEDATIYAISGGRRTRIGNVPGNTERTLSFRWPRTTTRIRFEIDFLAGPTCFTNELPWSPGEILQLQLPADPARTRGCG